jgi:hypothetical protein
MRDNEQTSCWNSSFWILLNTGWKLLKVTSIFLQTGTTVNSGLELIVDLPVLPVVQLSIPALVIGGIVAIYSAGGAAISDYQSNYITQNRDELNKHLREQEQSHHVTRSQPSVLTSEEESNPMEVHDDLEAQSPPLESGAAQETTPLRPPVDEPRRPWCRGLTPLQKAAFGGEIIEHAQGSTAPVYYIWLFISKVAININSNLANFIVTAVSNIIGGLTSVTEYQSTSANMEDYTKLMVFRKMEAERKLLTEVIPADSQPTLG